MVSPTPVDCTAMSMRPEGELSLVVFRLSAAALLKLLVRRKMSCCRTRRAGKTKCAVTCNFDNTGQ